MGKTMCLSASTGERPEKVQVTKDTCGRDTGNIGEGSRNSPTKNLYPLLLLVLLRDLEPPAHFSWLLY